jgi:hypothetical protein
MINELLRGRIRIREHDNRRFSSVLCCGAELAGGAHVSERASWGASSCRALAVALAGTRTFRDVRSAVTEALPKITFLPIDIVPRKTDGPSISRSVAQGALCTLRVVAGHSHNEQ